MKTYTIYDFLEAADTNNWGFCDIGATNNTRHIQLLNPRTGPYEPVRIDITLDDTTDTIKQTQIVTNLPGEKTRGLRPYPILPASAHKTIINTHHPLRAIRFFQATDRSIKALCEPHNINPQTLRTPAMRGYFNVTTADRLAIKLLSRHPAEIWGAENWIEAALRKRGKQNWT